MLFMPYDTESKSRNVLASPLGEEGHEVAKGWTVVRMIMILDVDVTAERRHYNTHRPLKGKRLTTFCASLRSGGRRLAVRTAMEHPIGALPRTPFPASRDFPSRGNEGYGEKNRRVIYFMYHSGVSPFGGCATTFPPQAGALQGSAKPCTHKSLYFKHEVFCPCLRGMSGAAGKGGERSEPFSRKLIMPYDTESKSRNADFISIARRAIHNPRGQRPRQT